MNPTDPSPNPADRGVDYESRDARLGPLLAAALGLLFVLVVVGWGMVGLFRVLADRFDRRPAPPVVMLPDSRSGDLQRLRLREDELLTTYGWVSREEQIVRIPIERAIQLTVEEANPRDE